ncbi:MAG: hypothetical protein FWG87_06010, partial [Defluviitaleaceae bacterium]|nr:hypothetical protein [Defluviitaleaceae bacterium]
MFKRIVSFVLVLTMILNLVAFPITANAENLSEEQHILGLTVTPAWGSAIIAGNSMPLDFTIERDGYIGALVITTPSDWISDIYVAEEAVATATIHVPLAASFGLTDITFTVASANDDFMVIPANTSMEMTVLPDSYVTGSSASFIIRAPQYDDVSMVSFVIDNINPSVERVTVGIESRVPNRELIIVGEFSVADGTASGALFPGAIDEYGDYHLVVIADGELGERPIFGDPDPDLPIIDVLTYDDEDGTFDVTFVVSNIFAGNVTIGIERRSSTFETIAVGEFTVSGGVASGKLTPGRLLDTEIYFLVVAIDGVNLAEQQIGVAPITEHFLTLTVNPTADSVTEGAGGSIPVNFTIGRDGYTGELQITTDSPWITSPISVSPSATTASGTVTVPATADIDTYEIIFTVSRVDTIPSNIIVNPAEDTLFVTVEQDTEVEITGMVASGDIILPPAGKALAEAPAVVLTVSGKNLTSLTASNFTAAVPIWITAHSFEVVSAADGLSATVTLRIAADSNTVADRSGAITVTNTTSSATASVTVTQDVLPVTHALGLTMTPSSRILEEGEGDTILVTFTVDRSDYVGALTISSTSPWWSGDITILGSVSTASGTITVPTSAIANTYPIAFTVAAAAPLPPAHVTVTPDTATFTVNITEDTAPAISTMTAVGGIVVPPAGKTLADVPSLVLNVTGSNLGALTAASFGIAAIPDWVTAHSISVTVAPGGLSATVTVQIAADSNTTAASRSGIVTIDNEVNSLTASASLTQDVFISTPTIDSAIYDDEGDTYAVSFEVSNISVSNVTIGVERRTPEPRETIAVGEFSVASNGTVSGTLTTGRLYDDVEYYLVVAIGGVNLAEQLIGVTPIEEYILGLTAATTMSTVTAGEATAVPINFTITRAGYTGALIITSESQWWNGDVTVPIGSSTIATGTINVPADALAQMYEIEFTVSRVATAPTYIVVTPADAILEIEVEDAEAEITGITTSGDLVIPPSGKGLMEAPALVLTVSGKNLGELSASDFSVLRADWLTGHTIEVSDISADGTGATVTVRVSAAANDTGASLSGQITVNNGITALPVPVSVVVTQMALPYIDFLEYDDEGGSYEVAFTVINLPTDTVTIGIENRTRTETIAVGQFAVADGRVNDVLVSGHLEDDEIYFLVVSIGGVKVAEQRIEVGEITRHTLTLAVAPSERTVKTGEAHEITVVFTIGRDGYAGELRITTDSPWLAMPIPVVAASSNTAIGIVAVPADADVDVHEIEFTVSRVAETPVNTIVTPAEVTLTVTVEDSDMEITGILTSGALVIPPSGKGFAEAPSLVLTVSGKNLGELAAGDFSAEIPDWLTGYEIEVSEISLDGTSATVIVRVSAAANDTGASLSGQITVNNGIVSLPVTVNVTQIALPYIDYATYDDEGGTYEVDFRVINLPTSTETVTIGIENRTTNETIAVGQFVVGADGTVTGKLTPGFLNDEDAYYLVVAIGGAQVDEKLIAVSEVTTHILELFVDPETAEITLTDTAQTIEVTFTVTRNGYDGEFLQIISNSPWAIIPTPIVLLPTATTATAIITVPAEAIADIYEIEFTVERVNPTPV